MGATVGLARRIGELAELAIGEAASREAVLEDM